MLSERLIRIVEDHAEELAVGAVRKLQASPHTCCYHRLSADELQQRLYEVYHDMGGWLLKNTDRAIQERYEAMGMLRFREGIPLSEVLWALVLTKDHLREWVGARIAVDSALDLFRQQEIYRLIGHFFDRAMCYTAEAYQRESALHREEGFLAAAR